MSERHKDWEKEAVPEMQRIIKDQIRMIEKLRTEAFNLTIRVRELEEELNRKPLAEVKRMIRNG